MLSSVGLTDVAVRQRLWKYSQKDRRDYLKLGLMLSHLYRAAEWAQRDCRGLLVASSETHLHPSCWKPGCFASNGRLSWHGGLLMLAGVI